MGEQKKQDEKKRPDIFTAGFSLQTLNGEPEKKSPGKPVMEENKEQGKKAVCCPACSGVMTLKTIPGKGKQWMHAEKSACKLSFKTMKEMESYRPEASPQPEETVKAEEKLKQAERQPERKIKKNMTASRECEVVDEAEIFTWSEPATVSDKEEEMKEIQMKDDGMHTGKLWSAESAAGKGIRKMKRISHEDAKKLHDRMEKNNPKPRQQVKPAALEVPKKKEISDKTEILKKPEFMLGYPTITSMDTGEIIELDKPSYIIGRAEGDYLLEKSVISKKHAQFITKNEKCYVKDLNSTNGTKVNGYMLPPDTEVEIKDGQTICFADEEFKFNYER